MNINLNTPEDPQDEIDEHVEIMTGASDIPLTGRVMLLSDPDYPGAYQVWTERQLLLGVGKPVWQWVNMDGEIIATNDPLRMVR